jgi:hypothetical protein
LSHVPSPIDSSADLYYSAESNRENTTKSAEALYFYFYSSLLFVSLGLIASNNYSYVAGLAVLASGTKLNDRSVTSIPTCMIDQPLAGVFMR